MTDVLSPSTTRIESLERSVEALEARLRVLERQLGVEPARIDDAVPAAVVPIAAALAEGDDDAAESFWDLALIGRTLMILGGAYLLRALTERDVVPEIAGMLVGLAYALFWLFAAYRVASASPWKATFEAGIATAIAFAIAVESTARFAIVPPEGGAAILAVVAAAVLGLAVARRLQPVAWIGVIGGVAALTALAMMTKTIVAPAAATFAVAAAASWAASHAGFPYLQWVPCVQSNLLMFAMPFVLSATGESRVSAIALLELALVLTSATLFVVIALRNRTLTVFGFIYVSLLFAIAIGGAGWMTQGSQFGRMVLAAATATAAILLWAAAAFRSRAEDATETRNYPAIVGTLLTIAGTYLLLPVAIASASWGVAAAVVAWVARPRPERSFALHASLFGVAASAGSGLLAFAFARTLVAGSGAAADVAAFITLVALTAAGLFLAVGRGASPRSMPRIAILAVATLGWCAAIIAATATVVPATEAGALSSVTRTVILSLAAVGIAAAGRGEAIADARRLVNPLLALIAIKLLVDDFRFGNATTLFVSLAAFGAALVLCARLRKKRAGSMLAHVPVAGGL